MKAGFLFLVLLSSFWPSVVWAGVSELMRAVKFSETWVTLRPPSEESPPVLLSQGLSELPPPQTPSRAGLALPLAGCPPKARRFVYTPDGGFQGWHEGDSGCLLSPCSECNSNRDSVLSYTSVRSNSSYLGSDETGSGEHDLRRRDCWGIWDGEVAMVGIVAVLLGVVVCLFGSCALFVCLSFSV